MDLDNLGIENRKRSVAIDERMKALGLLSDNAGPDDGTTDRHLASIADEVGAANVPGNANVQTNPKR